MSEITTADEAALAQQDFETLATAWGALNCFGWPEWLPNPEEEHYIPGGRRGRIMDWIAEAVGLRACFRYSIPWKHESEEDFNDFWRGTFENHIPSRARYYKQLESRVRSEIEARKAAQ